MEIININFYEKPAKTASGGGSIFIENLLRIFELKSRAKNPPPEASSVLVFLPFNRYFKSHFLGHDF